MNFFPSVLFLSVVTVRLVVPGQDNIEEIRAIKAAEEGEKGESQFKCHPVPTAIAVRITSFRKGLLAIRSKEARGGEHKERKESVTVSCAIRAGIVVQMRINPKTFADE